MASIWQEAQGYSHIKPIMASAHRVTDDQQLIATMGIVNSVEEQGVLEELLEETKPKKPEGYGDLGYLLITPFRYPPLKHGSRFGTPFEPSLFYASMQVSTALSETAYYRFVFLSGMQEPFDEPLQVTYSSFKVKIHSLCGVYLDKPPFDKYNPIMESKFDYQQTQGLGSSMRNEGVEAFEYTSARCPNRGKNIALFTPKALQSKQPETMERWVCSVRNEEVGFVSGDNTQRFSFKKEQFCINQKLPMPAA